MQKIMEYKTSIGITLALLSALIYAIQTAIVKHTAPTVSTPVLVFIQSIVCFLCIIPVIFAQGKSKAIKLVCTNHPWLHLARTVFSLGISYFLFYSVASIPLVDGVLLTNTAPLWVPIIGVLFLSRRIDNRLWMPLAIGFAGIVLVLKPGGEIFNVASLFALFAGICMAASMTLVKEAKNDSGLTNAFYYFMYAIPFTAIGAMLNWTPISLDTFGLLIGVGLLFFVVQLSLIYALKLISAQIASTLYLSNIIFAAIIGWIVWHTPLTLLGFFGIALTMTGAILTIRAQTKLVEGTPSPINRLLSKPASFV